MDTVKILPYPPHPNPRDHGDKAAASQGGLPIKEVLRQATFRGLQSHARCLPGHPILRGIGIDPNTSQLKSHSHHTVCTILLVIAPCLVQAHCMLHSTPVARLLLTHWFLDGLKKGFLISLVLHLHPCLSMFPPLLKLAGENPW